MAETTDHQRDRTDETPPRGRRRQQLIDATIDSIARFGLSNMTLAKVTQIAGLSPGIVSFYFDSKDALLLATLRFVAEEYETAWQSAVAAAGPDPAAQLRALIEVNFDIKLSAPARASVRYAFWGEARAREEYMKLCGDRDAAYFERVLSLCRRIVDEGGYPGLDAEALARAIDGMIDGIWQGLLLETGRRDREAARRSCFALLASLFPRHFEMPAGHGTAAPAAPARRGAPAIPVTLPAWTYDNAEFHALEREHVFLPNWQIVCHVSDVPKAGDYATLDMMGERAFVVRDEDGGLRAFHNVCRHRAHAIARGAFGSCKGALRCPYHGWRYGFDGRLKAVPAVRSFPGLDKATISLVPLDLEVFQGFVYIRFKGGGPSLAERLAPLAEELALYRFEAMRPLGDFWCQEIAVDWKNVWDNYLEGYHFVTGHPGLYELMGNLYDVEALPNGVARLSHSLQEKPARSWAARHYQKLLPAVDHLPDPLRRAWSYFPLFPGMSFHVYPDSMDFFQAIPAGPGRTILRGQSYALPDERREMRAARYLCARLNAKVQQEDEALIDSVQRGLASSSYSIGLLSEKEVIVQAFQDWIRARLPVARLTEAPPPGTVAARNAQLAG